MKKVFHVNYSESIFKTSMILLKYCVFIFALCAAALSSSIELGDMTFESRFGSPFKAQIDVPNVGNLSRQNLRARVAPRSTWQSLDISRSNYIDDIEVALVSDKNSKTTIFVSSKRGLNEPYLDLLIELRWPSGTILKNYIVLVPMGLETSVSLAESQSFSQLGSASSSSSISTNAQTYPREEKNVTTSKPDRSIDLAESNNQDIANSAQVNLSQADERISQSPEYNRIYITKESDTLESIAEELAHPQLTTEAVADILFDYNFYIATRNRVLVNGIRIEIPERSAFKSKSPARVTFSDEINVEENEVSNVQPSSFNEPIKTLVSNVVPEIDISQVIRVIPGVESSLAIFTPTERAEARIRALGFATAQQRLEGTVPNQVVTAGSIQTVLDRLLIEQGLPPSTASIANNAETGSLENNSLPNAKGETDSFKKPPTSGGDLGLNTQVDFGAVAQEKSKSSWSVFWVILGLLFLLLFIFSLIFIWCLFKRPDLLIRIGLPVAGHNGIETRITEFQDEDLYPGEKDNSKQVNLGGSSEHDEPVESKSTESDFNGYAHFFNEGNAYSIPDESLLNAKKQLEVENEIQFSIDEIPEDNTQKYARPANEDNSFLNDKFIDAEGSLQTIVLDLDKGNDTKENDLEEVFAAKDSVAEEDNSTFLDHLQDDLETFGFMEEEVEDIDISDELLPVKNSIDDLPSSNVDIDEQAVELSDSKDSESVAAVPDVATSPELIIRESLKDQISFDQDPAKVDSSAMADELESLSFVPESLDESSELDLVDKNATYTGSSDQDVDSDDDSQEDLFANVSKFELLNDEKQDLQSENGTSSLNDKSHSLKIALDVENQDKSSSEILPQINDKPLILNNLSTFEKVPPMEVLALIDTNVRMESAKGIKELSLFYIEVDNFEKFESKFGILTAEKLSLSVLTEISKFVSSNNPVMLNRFRQKCYVLMLPNITENDSIKYASSLVDELQARPIEIDNETHFFSMSIAIIPVNGVFESGYSAVASAQSLVRQIQTSKEDEPGVSVRLYQPNLSESLSNEALVAVGRRLLQSDSFNAVYRPIIGLKAESDMYLFESRLQLDSTLMDAEYPIDLLDRLYNSDLALELDSFLLSSSCIQLGIRPKDNIQTKVILNFSINTLIKSDFIEWFSSTISDFDIDPSNFVIQIDELSASRQMIKLSALRKKLAEIDLEMSMSQICFEHIPVKTLELLQLDYVKLHTLLSQHLQNPGDTRADRENYDIALETMGEMVSSAKQIASSVVVSGIDQAKLLPKLWTLGVHFIEGNYVAPESSKMQPPKSFLSNKET